jgi:hypothetical protein
MANGCTAGNDGKAWIKLPFEGPRLHLDRRARTAGAGASWLPPFTVLVTIRNSTVAVPLAPPSPIDTTPLRRSAPCHRAPRTKVPLSIVAGGA